MTTHYSIFQKPDGLYERLENQSSDSTRETAEKLGWKFISTPGSLAEAIGICEEHNRPILEARYRGEK